MNNLYEKLEKQRKEIFQFLELEEEKLNKEKEDQNIAILKTMLEEQKPHEEVLAFLNSHENIFWMADGSNSIGCDVKNHYLLKVFKNVYYDNEFKFSCAEFPYADKTYFGVKFDHDEVNKIIDHVLYSLTHKIQDVRPGTYDEISIPEKSFIMYIYDLQQMLVKTLNSVEYRKTFVAWRDAEDDEQCELGHELIKPFKKAFPVLGNTSQDTEEIVDDIFALLLK